MDFASCDDSPLDEILGGPDFTLKSLVSPCSVASGSCLFSKQFSVCREFLGKDPSDKVDGEVVLCRGRG